MDPDYSAAIRSRSVRKRSYRGARTDFAEQDLAGSTFHRVNLSGATFREVHLTEALLRDVDLSRTRVRAAYLDGVRMTGVEVPDLEIYGELGRLVVNGVDVVPLVEAELDRRSPERALMRPTDAEGFRTAFATLDQLWQATLERARALPAAALHEQVGDEWSFIETLRHLGFAHAWDRDVRPSLQEVLDLRARRRAVVAGVLGGLDDEGLTRPVTSATPFMADAEGLTVAQCLRVVLNEEWEHRLYAERDLDPLET